MAVAQYLSDARAILSSVAFYTTWPIVKLLHAAAYLLSPFWAVAQFILLPFTVLAQAILAILLLPFRLHLLEKVETIYIYLGIAGLIGFCAGAVLYFSFNIISASLSIDSASELDSKRRSSDRTVTAYRADRKRRKQDLASLHDVKRDEILSRRQRGLLAQTIIEEEDSDF